MNLCCTPAETRESLVLFDTLFGLPVLTERQYREILRKKVKGSTHPRAKAILAIEDDLSAKLRTIWSASSSDVLDTILSTLAAGKTDLTGFEVQEILQAVADAMGPGGFAPQVADAVRAATTEAYNFGRVTFMPKPSYNLVDTAAKDFLAQNQSYWIGEHYGAEVGPRLAESVQQTIVEQGLGREEAGNALKEIFGDEFGAKSDAYWEGTAANAATRSRNMGHVESFVEGGFTELEFVAVMDEATSEICRHLNGKIFKVAWAVDQRNAMLAAKTPEDVKAIAPWPKTDKSSMELLRALTPAQLAASGVMTPPLHFNCRSVLVVR